MIILKSINDPGHSFEVEFAITLKRSKKQDHENAEYKYINYDDQVSLNGCPNGDSWFFWTNVCGDRYWNDHFPGHFDGIQMEPDKSFQA